MRRTLLCCWAALTAATDVTFEPGPGLKKNEDGTYSRTYDAQAEGAAAEANTTAAAPKKPKRSFSINDIGKKAMEKSMAIRDSESNLVFVHDSKNKKPSRDCNYIC